MIDFSGKVIGEKDLGRQKSGDHSEDWKIGSYKPGVYFIKMKNIQSINK